MFRWVSVGSGTYAGQRNACRRVGLVNRQLRLMIFSSAMRTHVRRVLFRIEWMEIYPSSTNRLAMICWNQSSGMCGAHFPVPGRIYRQSPLHTPPDASCRGAPQTFESVVRNIGQNENVCDESKRPDASAVTYCGNDDTLVCLLRIGEDQP